MLPHFTSLPPFPHPYLNPHFLSSYTLQHTPRPTLLGKHWTNKRKKKTETEESQKKKYVNRKKKTKEKQQSTQTHSHIYTTTTIHNHPRIHYSIRPTYVQKQTFVFFHTIIRRLSWGSLSWFQVRGSLLRFFFS